MTMILGIDPGFGGALAFMDDKELIIYDMPTFDIARNGSLKKRISSHDVCRLLFQYKPKHAFVELVGTMPGQGISSAFSFGFGCGVIEGCIAAHEIPLTYVTPQKWKKYLQCPKDKDASRQRASQLMPQWAENWPLKKHDGRAEASLIAYYGRKYE